MLRSHRHAALQLSNLHVLALACVALGCGSPVAPLSNDDFAPALGVDLDAMAKTSSGIYYQDLIEGGGTTVRNNTRVTVDYDGWFSDGTLFASTRDEITDIPLEFLVGASQVIRGWDLGLPGMREGGIRRLVIPARYGYGEAGLHDNQQTIVPANTVLVFDVELLSVQ